MTSFSPTPSSKPDGAAKHPMPLYQTPSPTIAQSSLAKGFLEQLKTTQSKTNALPDDVLATEIDEPEKGYLSPSETSRSNIAPDIDILDPNIIKETGAEKYARQVGGAGCLSKPVGDEGDDDPGDGSLPPNDNNTSGGPGGPNKSGGADGKKPPQDNDDDGDDSDDVPDYYKEHPRLLLKNQPDQPSPPIIGIGWTGWDDSETLQAYTRNIVQNLRDQKYGPILILKDTSTKVSGFVTQSNKLCLAQLNRYALRDPAIVEAMDKADLNPARDFAAITISYLPEKEAPENDNKKLDYGGVRFIGGLHFFSTAHRSRHLYMIGGGHGHDAKQDLLTLDKNIPERLDQPQKHPGVIGYKALTDGSDRVWLGREDLKNIGKNIQLKLPDQKPAIIQITRADFFPKDSKQIEPRVNINIMPHSAQLAGKMDEFHIPMNPPSEVRINAGIPGDQFAGWTMNEKGIVVKAQADKPENNDINDTSLNDNDVIVKAQADKQENNDTKDISFQYMGQDQEYLKRHEVVKYKDTRYDVNNYHAFVRTDVAPLSTRGFVIPDNADIVPMGDVDDEKEVVLKTSGGRTDLIVPDNSDIVQMDDVDNEKEELLNAGDGRTDLLNDVNASTAPVYAPVDQDPEDEQMEQDSGDELEIID